MVENTSNPKKGKMSLRRTVEELRSKLEAEQKKSTEYLTRLKYLQADFENYEKRMKREREEIIKMCGERIITKMLNILDDLELAVMEGQKVKNTASMMKGLEMILSNLLDIFRQEGVVKIEALGKTFDPTRHEVASFIETDEVEENTVVRELRKGYLLNGKVIRASMVEIAKKPLKTGGKSPSKMEARS